MKKTIAYVIQEKKWLGALSIFELNYTKSYYRRQHLKKKRNAPARVFT